MFTDNSTLVYAKGYPTTICDIRADNYSNIHMRIEIDGFDSKNVSFYRSMCVTKDSKQSSIIIYDIFRFPNKINFICCTPTGYMLDFFDFEIYNTLEKFNAKYLDTIFIGSADIKTVGNKYDVMINI